MGEVFFLLNLVSKFPRNIPYNMRVGGYYCLIINTTFDNTNDHVLSIKHTKSLNCQKKNVITLVSINLIWKHLKMSHNSGGRG